MKDSRWTDRRHKPRVEELSPFLCQDRTARIQTIYFMRNLSAGGLMFEAVEPVTPRRQLEIEWYAPVRSGRRVRWYMTIGARVVWRREILGASAYEGSNRYQIGVAFEQITLENRARLEEYVRGCLKKECVTARDLEPSQVFFESGV